VPRRKWSSKRVRPAPAPTSVTNEFGLTIAIHDKEILILRDDDRWLLIGCGWGANPPLASLQPAGVWDEVMPDWLRGRRDEVVRLITEFRHVVCDEKHALAPGNSGSGPPPLTGLERARRRRDTYSESQKSES
jgi:hypothetical protein